MNNLQVVKIALLLMLSLLLLGCSGGVDERVYRYQDTNCTWSEPAKNLWVASSKYYTHVTGLNKNTDTMVLFANGQPGSIKFNKTEPGFSMGSIVLNSSYGIFVQQGYFHFEGDGLLPVQIANTGNKNYPARLTFPCLDNPGTEKIQVGVFSDQKFATKIAGLWWGNAVISILEDGVVVVDQPRIKAKDDDGNIWVSEWNYKVKEYVMIREE